MITRFQVQNYKALRDVTLELTRMHVLIGPNDTGKTSILEAVAALCRSVDHPLAQAFTGSWEGSQLVWRGQRDLNIAITADIDHRDRAFEYHLSCLGLPNGRRMRIESEYVQTSDTERLEIGRKDNDVSEVCRVASHGASASEHVREFATIVYDSLVGVHSYRWDGRFLSLPVAPDMKRRFQMESSGFGLALCLDDILGDDRNRFIELEKRFARIFPHIKSIKLVPEQAYRSPVDDPEQIPMLQKSDGKGIYFELTSGGEPIPARQVSDGVLLVLAYLAVLHLPRPPRVILVEEPENGIHPKRLQDVLTILRDLVGDQSQTQIILTTHSPYVVDLFEPEEVTLCQKKDDGSIGIRRLSDSKTVCEQLNVFTLGEIWTAEGDDRLTVPTAAEGESQG